MPNSVQETDGSQEAVAVLSRSEVASQQPQSDNSHSARSESAPSPLRSVETFEQYCAQVQTRLAQHAVQRTHFLQNAFERLTRLLHTARAVEDNALYQELWQQRVIVRELLEALNQVAASPVPSTPAGTAATPASVAPASTTSANRVLPEIPSVDMSRPVVRESHGLVSSDIPTLPLSSKSLPLSQNTAPNGHHQRNISPEAIESSSEGGRNGGGSYGRENGGNGIVEAGPRAVRHPVRPLVDIEADAVRLRESLRDWNDRLPLRTPEGKLHVPNALRLRAVACRQRRLEEEAGDTEVAEVTELSKDIVDLLDDADDQEYTVALDDELDPIPTAFQWGELAERYEETARAEEAFQWWLDNRAVLSVSDVQGLAEAVAAIQQRFNRLLFRIGARDPFQQQLFDDLRTWAKEAQCYLYSLRPKVPIAELIEKAQTIEDAWELAREPLRAFEQRHKVVDDVVSLVNEPNFGAEEAEDEARLQAALLKCREMRIPASDRRLRDALLPWAAFLESDEQFKDILREINLEWERRQDLGKAEEIHDEPEITFEALEPELEAVRAVTRGKRCLLLGGTCREENRRKIEEALQLAELVWPSTKPSDPLSRYDTEIRHSDIVALLTRFSRKEWKNAQDICARDGKKFVHLTTGYGVAQVIRHFYNQIAPQ